MENDLKTKTKPTAPSPAEGTAPRPRRRRRRGRGGRPRSETGETPSPTAPRKGDAPTERKAPAPQARRRRRSEARRSSPFETSLPRDKSGPHTASSPAIDHCDEAVFELPRDPDLFAFSADGDLDTLLYADLDLGGTIPPGRVRAMTLIRFGMARNTESFDAGPIDLALGDHVLVEGGHGAIAGEVIRCAERTFIRREPRKVIRKIKIPAKRPSAQYAQGERRALNLCRKRIRTLKLKMKVFRVDYNPAGTKATFYFSAETRIDFRELVRQIHGEIGVRIEMRQVGIRDEAKVTGGLGPCGVKLCCSSWIKSFHPVSIRMAKDQNIVLNPTRVSGMCGRLKCCLAYEQSVYREARKGLPKVGVRVTTPRGPAIVKDLDIPRRLVRAATNDGTVHVFPAGDIQPVARPRDKAAPASANAPTVSENKDAP